AGPPASPKSFQDWLRLDKFPRGWGTRHEMRRLFLAANCCVSKIRGSDQMPYRTARKGRLWSTSRSLLYGLLCITLGTPETVALAQNNRTFKVTDLAIPATGGGAGVASINNRGQIAAIFPGSDGTSYVMLWDGGEQTLLLNLNAGTVSINDR